MSLKASLIDKYNVPGPRYTSYPTVPYWETDRFNVEEWLRRLKQSFEESNTQEGISVYIHLPFCESLCTFCACHKRITRQHSVELPYIEALLKEWELYLEVFGNRPKLKELHLGGGTPTFFSVQHLEQFLKKFLSSVTLHEQAVLSFEGHPNNTTEEHLQGLYDLGFRRVSFGVQDYDPKVQQAIHRIQPFEKVKAVTEAARRIGYESISHDLIFGLPHQHWDSMEHTIRSTIALRPDRLAFYSYAHVPWVKGVGQRGFDERDLPSGEEKRQLYERGKQLLEALGYVEIGMDHFALPGDELYESLKRGTLHRNFMGYTSGKTQLMVGLGMSAIGDSWYAFGQNIKSVEQYQDAVMQGRFPIERGHLLNEEDLIVRRHILNLMCRLYTSWEEDSMYFAELPDCVAALREMEKDGLVVLNEKSIRITEQGRAFTRNVAMAFDLRLRRQQPATQLFSMTV